MIALFWEQVLYLNSLGGEGAGEDSKKERLKKKDLLSPCFLKIIKLNPYAKEAHFGVADFPPLPNRFSVNIC